MAEIFDIAIVGGGLAGAAAAVAAAKNGYGVIHFAPKTPIDRRSSALMTPSVDMLGQFGLIGDAAGLGTPLTRIRIIDATDRLIRAPETLFDAQEHGFAQFGYNFANSSLLSAFKKAAENLATLTTIALPVTDFKRIDGGFLLTDEAKNTYETRLLAGADGKKSRIRQFSGIFARERQLAQSALVADVHLGRGLDGESVEFHYANGPFTLVPAGGSRANLVWIERPEKLYALKSAPAGEIEMLLGTKSQNLFGAITLASPVASFPLSTLTAGRAGQDGVVLIGEAAHAFAPIGAQGLNLGIRDVADLLAALAGTSDGADWAARVSAAYAQKRAADLALTGAAVDALFKSLLSEFVPAQALRAGGLWALKTLPALRHFAFRAGMGGPRIRP